MTRCLRCQMSAFCRLRLRAHVPTHANEGDREGGRTSAVCAHSPGCCRQGVERSRQTGVAHKPEAGDGQSRCIAKHACGENSRRQAACEVRTVLAFPAFPARRTKQAVPTAGSGCVGTHMKSGHSTMTGITHTHLATQGATYRRERQRGVCARGTFFFARGTVVDAMQQNGVCVLPSSHSAPDLRVGKSARKIRSSRQAAKELVVGRVLQFDRWISTAAMFFRIGPWARAICPSEA